MTTDGDGFIDQVKGQEVEVTLENGIQPQAQLSSSAYIGNVLFDVSGMIEDVLGLLHN